MLSSPPELRGDGGKGRQYNDKPNLIDILSFEKLSDVDRRILRIHQETFQQEDSVEIVKPAALAYLIDPHHCPQPAKRFLAFYACVGPIIIRVTTRLHMVG